MICQICRNHPIGIACHFCGAKPQEAKRRCKIKDQIRKPKKEKRKSRAEYQEEWYHETAVQLERYNQKSTGIPELDEKIRKAVG